MGFYKSGQFNLKAAQTTQMHICKERTIYMLKCFNYMVSHAFYFCNHLMNELNIKHIIPIQ